MANMDSQSQTAPSPERIFTAATAYQQTAALKAAVDLDIFSAIGEGADTAADLAQRCGAAERGVRILCNALTAFGFLGKAGERYSLTPDTAAFLDRRSPAYLGSGLEFLASPTLVSGFANLTEAVRHGGTRAPEQGALAPDHPMWVQFARSMAPMMALPARLVADIVNEGGSPGLRVLDLAAGHGLFGVQIAAANPNAEIVAIDWPNVLEVATENAANAGVADRHGIHPGSALEVEFGDGYDVALLTNFLHHFDPETATLVLRKVHAALKEGGRAVVVEFVPNEDGVSPPIPGAFSLMLLVNTPAGQAYTARELEGMFRMAGFSRYEVRPMPPTPQTAVIGYR